MVKRSSKEIINQHCEYECFNCKKRQKVTHQSHCMKKATIQKKILIILKAGLLGASFSAFTSSQNGLNSIKYDSNVHVAIVKGGLLTAAATICSIFCRYKDKTIEEKEQNLPDQESNSEQIEQMGHNPATLEVALGQTKKNHSAFIALQEKDWTMLMKFTNLKNQDECIELGHIEIILEAMKMRLTIAKVQEQGCCILGKLSLSTETREKIGSAGGGEVILKAMKAHPTNADVQEHGCRALGNLACNDDGKVKIIGAGGIEVILEAMKTHPTIAKVQAHCCRTLGNLACNDDGKVKMIGTGTIEVILEAMKTHPTNVEVQGNGCFALGNLANDDDDKVKKIVREGGINVILEAMKRHPTIAEVQEDGCFALCKIASSSSRNDDHNDKVKIVGAGGINEILEAMKAHSTIAEEQKECCKLLSRLASNCEDKK